MNASVFDDLESLRLTPEDAARLHAAIPAREFQTDARKRRNRRFIRGPLPWSQLCTASRLPGKAVVVWLLLHHRSRLRRQREVTLPNGMLAEFGVDRSAKARALRDLECAGLVWINRVQGQSPRVTLVEPTEASAASAEHLAPPDG